MKTKTRSASWERLEARINFREKTLLVKASELEGRSITDFVVSRAVEDAKRVIREHELIVLNENDQKRFVSALLHPPAPNQKLRAVYGQYVKSFSR
jgi:uncharacterized protein (DUF1778 family)